jgi:hypothetical protein
MERAKLASAKRNEGASSRWVSFRVAASRGRVMGVDMDFLVVSPDLLALPEI